MIPKYPFRVVTTVMRSSPDGPKLQEQTKNFENVGEAMIYRSGMLNQRYTKRVQVLMVVDDTKPHVSDSKVEREPTTRDFIKASI